MKLEGLEKPLPSEGRISYSAGRERWAWKHDPEAT